MQKDKNAGRLDSLKIKLFSKTLPDITYRINLTRWAFREISNVMTEQKIYDALDADIYDALRAEIHRLDVRKFRYDPLQWISEASWLQQYMHIVRKAHEGEINPYIIDLEWWKSKVRDRKAREVASLMEKLPWFVHVYKIELKNEGLIGPRYADSNPGSLEVLLRMIGAVLGLSHVAHNVGIGFALSVMQGLYSVLYHFYELWSRLPRDHPSRKLERRLPPEQRRLDEFFQ